MGTDWVRKNSSVKNWDYDSSDDAEDVSLSLVGSRSHARVSVALIRPWCSRMTHCELLHPCKLIMAVACKY